MQQLALCHSARLTYPVPFVVVRGDVKDDVKVYFI